MLNKLFTTLLLTAFFITSGTPVAAQAQSPAELPDNVPGLLVKANEAYVAKDPLTFRRALERLHEMRPYNSEYMYQLVIAHAMLDEKTQAYDMMLAMQQSGLSYDLTLTDATNNIRGTEVFDYVNDLMKLAGDPFGEAYPAFTLPPSVALPETMEWDESRQKFLVGTVADGSIHAVDKDGQITPLIKADKENGMWSIFDILVDQPRNRLWVTSAAIPVFSGYDPVDKGRSALFEFDLETLKLVRRHPVPVDGNPHVLGSMALSPNGDIYIVDRALPLIYVKAAAEERLKPVMVAKNMISMRGVAMQPDGNVMYVADREMGIMVVDIKGSRSGKLKIPETLNLGGIDGLYLWNNHLIVIQNGIKPQRVMRLELDTAGIQVGGVRPLAVAQSAFDFPSFGALQGDDIYYFASSKTTVNKDQPESVAVLRTPVDSSEDLKGPDMEAFIEERHRKLAEQREAYAKEAAAKEAEKDAEKQVEKKEDEG